MWGVLVVWLVLFDSDLTYEASDLVVISQPQVRSGPYNVRFVEKIPFTIPENSAFGLGSEGYVLIWHLKVVLSADFLTSGSLGSVSCLLSFFFFQN